MSSQGTITPGLHIGPITSIIFFYVFIGHNNHWLHIGHNNSYPIFHVFTGHNNPWVAYRAQ
ncbi:hypothetical protein EJD97_020799 [Solanum chilense]|uniref:Uncharacterized protein n=1 Tax=Solanum chilense TaxID=4083 RepID=A0A6N2CCS6_SOLCI|nr:hypothetical protein EJD97_020799 [Solanum chilense]